MIPVRARFDDVLVCTRSDLVGLPRVELPDGVTVREMDMHDGRDVRTWLDLHNAAYGHEWTDGEFRAAILDHRHIRVTRTFFLALDGEPVGAASIGRFRRNEQVGAGHYLGVLPRVQGLGLGHALVAFRYRQLRDEGVDECESQTHIGRTRSLLLHFGCGFLPKWRLDPWNNPDEWSAPVRIATNARLAHLHRRWARRARSHPASAAVDEHPVSGSVPGASPR